MMSSATWPLLRGLIIFGTIIDLVLHLKISAELLAHGIHRQLHTSEFF
jgi:hypothetical protein